MRWFLFVAVALALSSTTAHADAVEIGGRIASYLRVPLTGFDRPIQQLSTSAWLDANARMTTGTFAKAQGVTHLLTPSIAETAEVRASLREAFIGGHKDGLETRVGQQVVAWGNADIVNAIDFLGARDYTFFSATPDAQRISAPCAQVTYAPGESPLRIALVWQPVAPRSRVLVPKGLLPPGVVLLPDAQPAFTVAASELAVKLGWSPGGWDVALVGFRGKSHMPEAFLSRVTPTSVEIGRAYRDRLAAGIEASATFDSWVLRFEGAYVATENHDGKNPVSQPTHVDAIAGVERPLGERFRASAQAIVRAHPLFMRPDSLPPIEQAIAKANAVTLNYTHVVRPGGTMRIAYTSEDESLELEVAGMAYAVGFDWVVQPQITYRPFTAVTVQVGLQVFGGAKNSLGSLDGYSGAFAQSTYAF